MVVDEHARVRHGLRVFLSTCADLEIVAEAGSAMEALRLFTDTRPQVVVMELAAPSMDSPIVTRRMKEIDPNCHIIALASYADPEIERRALEAGALCCLFKESSAGMLLETIRRAHAGPRYDRSLGSMPFVQGKTGESAEGASGVPSDGIRGAPHYDGTAAMRTTRSR